ncbi:SGNH/GDSL hydrolase family protein [Amycolatopsis thermoflava]|uniref:SGNH/GDSL hydrolase family protein n=1 Tax=Amycolatopsis thermoflava TaxID=84480 RepID=UPI000409814A|nr:SGNH/GDSL hydrolase family protein [Amycolatopsis thermoflava]
MRRFGWIGAALLLVLFSVTPASAGQHDYLALGDSVAFGYRPPAVTPPADYFDASNFAGYPERYSPNVTNASCPGETTASMIIPGAQSNGCENSVGSPFGYRTIYPLHVSYSGTQLEYAVWFLKTHPRTRLVTIDIGANDLFVCQQTTPDQCTGASFPVELQRISRNLTTIFAALRGAARYRHDLVLVSYYALDYRDPVAVAQVQALNAALAGPTLRFGGVVADGFGAFQEASRSTGGDPCAAGLLIALPTGGCDVHPTAKGHAVLAGAVEDAVAKGQRHAA